MIPTSNHVHSCIWHPNDHTYINLVTNVTSSMVYGRCLSSTRPGYFNSDYRDVEHITWTLRNWNEDKRKSIIIDLGHIDNFPELLI